MKPLGPHSGFWFACSRLLRLKSKRLSSYYWLLCAVLLRREFRTSDILVCQLGCLLACSTYHRSSLSVGAFALLGLRNHERALRGLKLEAWISTGRFLVSIFLGSLFICFCIHALFFAESLDFSVYRNLFKTEITFVPPRAFWRSPLWVPANGSCPLLLLRGSIKLWDIRRGCCQIWWLRHICAAFTGASHKLQNGEETSAAVCCISWIYATLRLWSFALSCWSCPVKERCSTFRRCEYL